VGSNPEAKARLSEAAFNQTILRSADVSVSVPASGRRGPARLPLAIAVLASIAVRAIPELLAGPWPLGFDAVFRYAPFVHETQESGLGVAMSGVITERLPPLFFLFLGIPASVIPAEPFAFTKVAGVLLAGLLALSMYYFARRGLEWNTSRSLLVVLLTSLYFVPLRFSWDMYNNTLGYAFAIIALVHLPREASNRVRPDLVFFTMALFSMITSELTAVLLGAISVVFLAFQLRARRAPALVLMAVSGLSILLSLVYLRVLFPPLSPSSPLAPPTFAVVFPFNYVGVDQDIYAYPSVIDVYTQVLALGAMLFLPFVPLAVRGAIADSRVVVWGFVLALAGFSILFSPFAAVPLWHRWLFMLVFPVILMTANALAKVHPRKVLAYLLAILLLGVPYLVAPPEYAFVYYSTPVTTRYVPSSMLQNTVPLSDCQDVVDLILWFNSGGFESPVLLAPARFAGWAHLYARGADVFTVEEPSQINNGNFSAYRHVFYLYWAPFEGWFDASVMPNGLVLLREWGRIALYERLP